VSHILQDTDKLARALGITLTEMFAELERGTD
jgi:hypothetical protein